MTFGSLFSGVGGLDLGLERAGMECRWQVEIDPFCTKVLEKHWPKVKRYGDIRTVRDELERVDCIAGGFPCQDISYAGNGGGITGERSGLWFDFARIIRTVGPRIVLVENVPALLDRGMGDVLGTLATLGFDAEWSSVSACSMGAPHMRQRMFIVAYANGFNGWSRVRNPDARWLRQISPVDSFESARISWQARLENPSELYRGADGVPFGMDRNRGIGNAVVPAVAEWLGRRIIEASA